MDNLSHQTDCPRSPQRHDADDARLRHARDRSVGFTVGRFHQPPPMLFTRDGHNVFLGDMYRGHSAFLICAGPSLGQHDLSQLDQAGFLTCGINNAATIYRPHLWVSVDDPGNFSDTIWCDPGIMKFVPLCHMEKRFTVRTTDGLLTDSELVVGDAPAVFGYRRNESFRAEHWLYEDTFNWGNRSDLVDAHGNKGSRSIMYIALRMLYYLGIRRVFLLGCDFRMRLGAKNYAFEQDRSPASVRGNNQSYKILNDRLGRLAPYFEREGFKVFNCTPESGLVVFPSISFAEAIDSATSVVPKTVNTQGMYDRKARSASDTIQHCECDESELPQTTLVTAVDRSNVEILMNTWATWMRFRSWLHNIPAIIIVGPGLDTDGPEFQFVQDHHDVRFVRWTPDDTACHRDRWSRAFLHVPAKYVTTPWYLKLEAEAVAYQDRPWVFPKWFQPDDSGQLPAFITSPWGYTKPADAIEKLDCWADHVPGLSEFDRLDLPYRSNDKRIRHDTISTWCFFGNLDWTKQVLQYAPEEWPCSSHDTFVSYCAARRRDRTVKKRMKQYSWDHSFSGQERLIDHCRHILTAQTPQSRDSANHSRKQGRSLV